MIDSLIGVVTLLALRSLALLFLEKKTFSKKVVDILLILFFAFIDVLLFVSADFNFKIILISTLISLGIIIPFLCRRIKYGSSYPFLKKFMGSLAIFVASGITLGISSLTDRPILKITLTGQTKQETVIWKNPDSDDQK